MTDRRPIPQLNGLHSPTAGQRPADSQPCDPTFREGVNRLRLERLGSVLSCFTATTDDEGRSPVICISTSRTA